MQRLSANISLKPHPFAASSKPKGIQTLKQYCVFTLIQYRHCLENVGWIETEALRDILRHCSVQELTSIEDATKEGSDRDLQWYTWDLWYILYCKEYGRPRSDLHVPDFESEPPVDYVAPRCEGQVGDWRWVFYDKAEQNAAKIREFSARMAQSKQQHSQQEERNVKAVVINPPAVSRRRASSNIPRATKNKPANNALFSRPKSSQHQQALVTSKGWGKAPIQSMIKKPQAPGLSSKGIKIVGTAAARAKQQGTGSSMSTPTSVSGRQHTPSPSPAVEAKPKLKPLTLHSTPSGERPAPPPRPPGSTSKLFVPAPPKRQVSALSGVDLAELVAAATSAKRPKQS